MLASPRIWLQPPLPPPAARICKCLSSRRIIVLEEAHTIFCCRFTSFHTSPSQLALQNHWIHFIYITPLARYAYTDKKGIEVFLISKEIQMGSVAKSNKKYGFLIMRKCGREKIFYQCVIYVQHGGQQSLNYLDRITKNFF
jgi:hypothetical protein